MLQLQQHEHELAEHGVSVLIVTFEKPAVAAEYVAQTQIPWPMLIDENRTLYNAYEMGLASWRKLLSPSACWGYIKLLFRGHRLRSSTGDVHQLGGNVLIDPNGAVQYRHVSNDPMDRPEVAALLSYVVRSAS